MNKMRIPGTLILSFCMMLLALASSANNWYEAYHLHLGNYPSVGPGRHENAQGLPHDSDNWFITQTLDLWKAPVPHDLDSVSPNVTTNNASGKTIYVDWRGVSKGEDGSSAHPFTTVALGYSAAGDGDIIIIRAGIYPEDITFSKAVTVKNEGGPVRIGKSVLRVKLQRSLVIGPADNPDDDKDHDRLVDSLENALANEFRPYCIFDSDEGARQEFEPVTLFQVRPVNTRGNNLQIMMKWVFLFKRDGGYGPDSWCSDTHDGDNDDALYELTSNDAGVTWDLTGVGLSFKGLKWPTNSRLGAFDPTHPVIYMSAHKHHEYFTRDWDHQNSLYSGYGCNDDVNGRGARVLVNLQSIGGSLYNNVGEPEHRLINDLSVYYPGHSAWGGDDFYAVGPIRDKWMTHPFA